MLFTFDFFAVCLACHKQKYNHKYWLENPKQTNYSSLSPSRVIVFTKRITQWNLILQMHYNPYCFIFDIHHYIFNITTAIISLKGYISNYLLTIWLQSCLFLKLFLINNDTWRLNNWQKISIIVFENLSKFKCLKGWKIFIWILSCYFNFHRKYW